MNNKTGQSNHRLSLRSKIIAGFAVLLLLIVVGMGLMLWQGMRLTDVGGDVIEVRQPAMRLALQLSQDINLATAELNAYLLTGHASHKNRFRQLETGSTENLSSLTHLLTNNGNSEQVQRLTEVGRVFAEFRNLATQAIYLRDHPSENYPGLSLAEKSLNPLNLEYMGIINNLKDEVIDWPPGVKQTRILSQITELRYTWSQMINSVRIFFSSPQQQNLDNINLYLETNGKQLQRLVTGNPDLGFDDVEQLVKLHKQYQANLPAVVEFFQSDRRRADIRLMNTQVSVVTDKLHLLLNDTATEQVSASRQAGDLLVDHLEQAQWLGLVVLIASLLVGGVIIMVILNGTAPITRLARYARSVSLDDPLDVDPELRARGDEVGGLARAFHQMIERLTESYRQISEAKGVLEQRVSERTAQLSHKANELAQINTELDQFSYVVSHDLKAPLRAIANLSEWIEEDLEEVLTDDTRKQMTLLRSRVARMNDLIHGILQYSRVGRIDTEMESIDVNELLAEIIAGLAVPEGLVIDIDDGMPVLVAARVPLSQVFANLLSNAIKYHHQPQQGHVQVSVQEVDGKYYKFSVSDNGPGIAAEHHKKVFGIFQTLNARDEVESTGVGLSIVKKIVETQGGKIGLDSAEGEGSSFYFTIPKNNKKGHAGNEISSINVVLTDDDQPIQGVMKNAG